METGLETSFFAPVPDQSHGVFPRARASPAQGANCFSIHLTPGVPVRFNRSWASYFRRSRSAHLVEPGLGNTHKFSIPRTRELSGYRPRILLSRHGDYISLMPLCTARKTFRFELTEPGKNRDPVGGPGMFYWHPAISLRRRGFAAGSVRSARRGVRQ